MMCFVGLLDLEYHLGRHFHHNFVVYLNQYQYRLASAGRHSTPLLMGTMLLSPFVLEPSFFNVNTVTWACVFVDVHHYMFNGPDGKNCPGAS